MRVSILIPVYNEFTTLPQVLERVADAALPEGCSKEIIVVDDGSNDGTSALAQQLAARLRTAGHDVVVHHSLVNFGKGAAVRAGIAKATGEIMLIQDGDLEYDPSDYVKLLEPLVHGEADIVYGSRFLGKPSGMALPNLVANRLLTLAANVLYGAGITDEATAYKAFRAPVLREVRLEAMRFEFCPEVTAKLRRMGRRIQEVPISYEGRSVIMGKKIRWQDGVEAMWTLLKYRFVRRHRFDRRTSADALPLARAAQQGRVS